MAVFQIEIVLPKFERGFHLIDDFILSKLPILPEIGMLQLFLKHTSAALSINENADPSVRLDFENSINHLIRENESFYTHVYEGSDDMPAHVKTSLFGSSLLIPISNSKLNLGTWQGIYLCEFRNNGGSRSIVASILS